MIGFFFAGKDTNELFKKIAIELIEYKFGASKLTCEERVKNIIKIFEDTLDKEKKK